MSRSGDKRVFGIYDGGQLVLQGTAREIEKKIHLDRSSVFQYARIGRKFNKRYDIVEIFQEEKKETKPRLSKFDRQMDCITRHLDEYGNTVLPCDEKWQTKRYLNELKDRGYNVRLDIYRMMDTKYLTLDDTRRSHGKVYTDYIVTKEKG